jgi:predicted CXXCH cytochrome family protein
MAQSLNDLFKKKSLPFFIVLVLTIFLLTVAAELAQALPYYSGKFSEGTADIIEITSDPTYLNYTSTFNPGDTIYLRVTTTRIPDSGRKNRLRLNDYLRNQITSSTWTQTSATSPYVYEATLVVPNPATSYYVIDAQIESAARDRFRFSQTIEVTGVNQNFYTYRDAGYTTKAYMFTPGSTMYVRLYGSGTTYSAANTKKGPGLKDYANNKTYNWATPPTVTQNGNWYDFSLVLPTTGLTDGWWYSFEVKLKDTANADIARVTRQVGIDTTPPDTVIASPTGGTLTSTSTVITGTASDNMSVESVGVAIIRNSDSYYWDGANSTWTASTVWNQANLTSPSSTSTAWSYTWNLPVDDGGSYTIQAKATDGAAQDDPTPASVTVSVDNTPPQVTAFNINGGAGYTTTASVSLDSTVTGATEMRFAESTSALTLATYQPYSSSAPYTLSSGDGVKTVYAQYKDSAGNETTPAAVNTYDSIVYDTTAPTLEFTDPSADQQDVTIDPTIQAQFYDLGGLDPSTVNSSTFYLKDSSGTTVTATITYNPVSNNAYLHPNSLLSYDSTYTAYLTSAIKDMVGNSFSGYTWTFYTGREHHLILRPSTIDSYIDEANPSSNFGLQSTMKIASALSANQRLLLQFDLSSLQNVSAFEEAELKLFMNQAPGASRSYGAYSLQNSWTEAGVTWNSRDGSNNWSSGGGDYNSSATTVTTTGIQSRRWLTWLVTSDIESWYQNPSSNFGWLIKDITENDTGSASFYTKQYNSDTSLQPKLEIGYLATTATISPSNVYTGQSHQTTITVSNVGTDTASEIHAVSINIPSGYTNIPLTSGGYNLVSSNGGNWIISQLPTGPNGPQQLKVKSTTLDLSSGDSLQIGFTVNAPLTSGVSTWTVTPEDADQDAAVHQLPVTVNPDLTSPTSSISSPTGNSTITTTGSFSITGTATDSASGVKQVEVEIYDNSSGRYWDGTNSTWTASSVWNLATGTNNWSYNWLLPTVDNNAYTITSKATDYSNNSESPLTSSVTVYVDNVAPTGSVEIENGASYVNTATVTLAPISAADGSGLGQMQFSNDGNSWSTWESYGASRTGWDLTNPAYGGNSSDGSKTVFARFKDVNGNVSTSTSDNIILDTTPPAVSTTTPANGATDVPLEVTVTASFFEASQMDTSTIDNTNFYLKDSSGTVIPATVSYNSATKTAYLKPNSSLTHDIIYTAYLTDNIKDIAGNRLASIYSWNFTVADLISPDTAITDPTDGQTLAGQNKLLTGTASDNGAVSTVTVGITRNSDGFWWDDTNSTWTASAVWNIATITSGQGSRNANWQYSWALPVDDGGGYIIKAKAYDSAGNTDTVPASVTVQVDNTPPSINSFLINNGEVHTTSTAVSLDSSVTGAAQMRFAESTSALASAAYQSYQSTYSFTLSSGDGTKTVYAQYKDSIGNETTPATAGSFDEIVLDTAAPVVNQVNPPNGSSNAGEATTVTATFIEANQIDTATVNGNTFYLKDPGNNTVTATVVFDPTQKRATLTPTDLLTQGATYTAYLTSGIKDAAGNSLSPYSWSFTITDSTPPDTVITDPTGGILAGTNKIITGGASDNVSVSSVKVAIIRDADGYYWDGANSTWTASSVWNIATITSGGGTPSASWQYNWQLPQEDGANYTIQAKAVDGASSPDPTPASVSVVVDTTAPTINSFSINSGASYSNTRSVTLNSDVAGADFMRFAESTAALSSAAYQSYATSANFTLSVGDGDKTVYAQYKDQAGNQTQPAVSGSFATITLDTIKPVVASVYPANNATDTSVNVMVTATFTEANQIDTTTVNSSTFYLKDPGGATVAATVNYDPGSKIASLTPDAPLSYETTYTAYVTTGVTDLAGNHLATNKVWSFRTSPMSNHPPGAPANLVVKSDDLKNELISWDPPLPSSDPGGDFNPPTQGGYNIYRGNSANGPWSKINTSLVVDTNYVDVDYGSKGIYYYLVKAVDGGGSESNASNVADNKRVSMSKMTSTVATVTLESSNGYVTLEVPPQPSAENIAVNTATSTPNGITLITDCFNLTPSGTNFSPVAKVIFRTPGDPTGAKIVYWDGNNWQQVTGGRYTYDQVNQTVSYDNITHFSYYGVTNPNDSTPPSAPGTLTVSTPAEGQIRLNWGPATDNESGISGYIVYRSLSSFTDVTKHTDAQVIATPGNVLTYLDTNVIRGETYYYAVSAENGAGLEGSIGNVETTTATGKENAHVNYSTNSNLCRDCHKVHGAPKNTARLPRKAPEIENCYVCHDGTGSDYNIRITFENKAAHDTSMTPSPSTNNKCTECHNPHGIGNAWMTRLSEENLCYRCHNDPSNSVNGWNIETQFNRASRHAVTTTTGDGLTGAKAECTSCHGPHTAKQGSGISDFSKRLTDPFNTYNLWTGTLTNFCLQCHKSGNLPEATATISTFVPYTITFPNVGNFPFFPGWDKSAFTANPAGHSQSYSCQTCHHPHGSPNQRLQAYFNGASYETTTTAAGEENLCYQCHKSGGPTGAKDLKTQFAKASAHPITNSGIHADTETASNFGVSRRHAECTDCHDVHKAKSGTHTKGTNSVSNVLLGAIGVEPDNSTSTGAPATYTVTGVSKEYQLCLKCHSLYTNLSTSAVDLGALFNTNNPSYHPVEATGTNGSIDSTAFVSPWSSSSLMYCSDCHTTSDSISTTTPSGPHGSDFYPLLKDAYSHTNSSNGSQTGTDLCYDCHSYSVYHDGLAGSRFQTGHQNHVGTRGESCYYCHDVHGNVDNVHLIRIKEISETSGTTSFTHNASGGGCTATCHNQPTTTYYYTHDY